MCSLADEYLDTALAYSAQIAKPKSRVALVCETVRYQPFSDNVDVWPIAVGRLQKNIPSSLSTKEAGLSMISYAPT